MNALAAIKAQVGELDRITQIIKVVGFVASDPEFTEQPSGHNGASKLLAVVKSDGLWDNWAAGLHLCQRALRTLTDDEKLALELDVERMRPELFRD